MKKSITKTAKKVKRKYNRDLSPVVADKNLRTVMHNMRLAAKMCDLAFTVFCGQKLNHVTTFSSQKPRMSHVITAAKISGVRYSTFLNKKLKIKLITA